MHNRLILCGIFSFLLSFSSLLTAQNISYNEEFLVNSSTVQYDDYPSITNLFDGGFVICWESNEHDGSGRGIYAQVFNSVISKRGSELLVNTQTLDDQRFPSISSLSDSGFVICWHGPDSSEYGVFAQLFNSDGSKRGHEFQVNTYNNNFQWYPSVCNLVYGGFVVCWASFDQDGSGPGIYGQIFNNDGSKRGSEFLVNTYTLNTQMFPSICSLLDGSFIICWQSFEQDGNYEGIYAQLFNNDGSKRGSEFQVNTYTKWWQQSPSVSSLQDSGFVVCWQSGQQDGSDAGIFAQLFNSDGTRRGIEFQVNSFSYHRQSVPCVSSSLMNGYFAIGWQSYTQDGSGNGIYAQIFNNDGSKQGSEFLVNTYTESDQSNPCLSYLSNDYLVISWSGPGQDGNNSGIFGKYFLNNEIHHQLATFNLLNPSNDSLPDTTSVLFKWQQSNSLHINFPFELEYYLFLDEDQEFRSPLITPAIFDTNYTIDDLIPDTTYFWKVLAINIDRDSLLSNQTNMFRINQNAVSVNNPKKEISQSFELCQNYPNPFNPTTIISYSIPKTSFVIIKIYDLLGREVANLVNEEKPAGEYNTEFNANNLSSGIYFYSIQVESYMETKKMVLIR